MGLSTGINSLLPHLMHALYRDLYGQRFATVEPVFGNIRHNKRLDRFTLRGQKKVDAQWKLYAMVHNIEKLANHGYAMQKEETKSRNMNA